MKMVVRVRDVHYTDIEVDAVNKNDAIKKANEIIDSGEYLESFYDYGLESDSWDVFIGSYDDFVEKLYE